MNKVRKKQRKKQRKKERKKEGKKGWIKEERNKKTKTQRKNV